MLEGALRGVTAGVCRWGGRAPSGSSEEVSHQHLGLGSGHAGLLILDPSLPIGLPINDAIKGGDTVFDIEITPNRPDCQSHLGIARELAAWFKLTLNYPQEKFRGDVSGAPARDDLLKGVRVDSPEEVQPAVDKANAIDDRPVVVDFRVDAREKVFPMVPAGFSNDDVVLPPSQAANKDRLK